MTWNIREGCALDVLPTLDAGSVQTCVTSPPYWGLRDYGRTGQIGLEATPEAYVERLVAVFREVRRVLADDGVLWLNLGDSYASSVVGSGGGSGKSTLGVAANGEVRMNQKGRDLGVARQQFEPRRLRHGVKVKDLIGIPWRVAFALQADGWYLRSDIIWSKPNPMPESVRDRCTKAHEYLFMLTKRSRYYYDADAMQEPSSRRASGNHARRCADGAVADRPADHLGRSVPWAGTTRNRRSVWTVTTRPYPGAHFAVMPPALVEPCIKAGSRIGDTVLDPFSGAGTVGLVARRLQRQYVGVELNADYAALSRGRIEGDAPLFNRAAK
jgi:DNA modification methylase